jgi:hypothetical protein
MDRRARDEPGATLRQGTNPTFEDRVAVVTGMGFTGRQARFLTLVALHSGYCLRRQYAAFAGLEYGKNVRDFLDRLVALNLARRITFRRDRGHIYHLFARALYAALRTEDNRNRRHTSPALIARKLMLLDYVLTQPDRDWYVTEPEKVDLFVNILKVPKHALPQRTYDATRHLARPTVRYCVQKLPIFVTGEPSRVHFVCLVTDPAARDISLFVREHNALLAHLTASRPGPAFRASVREPLSDRPEHCSVKHSLTAQLLRYGIAPVISVPTINGVKQPDSMQIL